MNTMTTPKRHTGELVEQHAPIERAECPTCHGQIEVFRIGGRRRLQYHHDPALGYFTWCGGSDKEIKP